MKSKVILFRSLVVCFIIFKSLPVPIVWEEMKAGNCCWRTYNHIISYYCASVSFVRFKVQLYIYHHACSVSKKTVKFKGFRLQKLNILQNVFTYFCNCFLNTNYMPCYTICNFLGMLLNLCRKACVGTLPYTIQDYHKHLWWTNSTFSSRCVEW